jgi:hypothetical protein
MKCLIVAGSLLLFGCGSSGGPGSITPGTGGVPTSTGGSAAGGTGGGAATGGTAATGGATATGGTVGTGTDAGSAAPDAAAPVETPPSAGALETVQVPAAGTAVAMKTSLDMGQLFLLKATGSADFGGQKVDAEYAFGGAMPADEMGTADYGVDIGMLQIHAKVHTTVTPPGPGRMKWGVAGGTYREDHVYYMTVTGEGKALSLKLTGPGGAGTGAVTVALFRLSPAPPTALGNAIDSVDVPFTKTMVMSAMTPENNKLYILQASGTGKVGGGGTALGDAEYMDWPADGSKYNEGEAGADFGVGIDESEVLGQKGPGGYKARLRWWGPWRMDHTYYMIFTGTGKPIQMLYFDSGYGDNNMPMDKIVVKIFPAP